jgi:hypothetical protein
MLDVNPPTRFECLHISYPIDRVVTLSGKTATVLNIALKGS